MEDFYVCQTCYAMVLNDYYYEHQRWHDDDHPKGEA